jgi:hypothetical protein
MSQGFLIGENLLGQIKDTVKRVQGEPIVGNISRIETRFEDGPPTPTESKTFRICTFTGAWSINGTKTVTFRGVTATPNTVSATNLFWPIPEGPQRACSIAKDGTAWYLLVPQLYAANAATAASLTTASLEFKTLPVVALATSSTAVFSVSISTCSTAAT